MRRIYLGDSYDIVKRFWADLLSAFAPLFAEPRFIPDELRSDFSQLTGIGMLAADRPAHYSILNDPDTGVRSPTGTNQSEGRSHVTLATIASQCKLPGVACVVTFDQSNHRVAGLAPADQRALKLQHLAAVGVSAFYYASHAPFLFASASDAMSRKVADSICAAGVPVTRLERGH